MRLRRILQGLSLLLFCLLLFLTASPAADHLRVDLFLRMDPLVLLGTLLSGRVFIGLLLPAVAIAVLTLFLGRFFCSFLCPLGTTVDLADRLLQKPRKKLRKTGGRPLPHGRFLKYLILSFIAGSALAGTSLFLLASPLSLATRFYGLIVYPVLAASLNLGITCVRQGAGMLGTSVLEYASFDVPGVGRSWITLALMALVLAPALVSRRFWCRCLCPAGALFALLSWRPAWKRRVSDACTGCGACRRACSMDAVAPDPRKGRAGECILCAQCREVCPEEAVTFPLSLRPGGPGHGRAQESGPESGLEHPLFSKLRRTLLLSGAAGAGGAIAAFTLPGPLHSAAASRAIIRPPGAVPEKDFLSRCIRCGECMKACPTNTLQPTGLAAGPAGFFTPVVSPRRGPCEPTCVRCGRVCPTGAVRELVPEEKVCARIGTAAIVKRRCITWEKDRECLVCDEVCPFGAVELRREKEGRVARPFVESSRCNGCGFCEQACPVEGPSAIVVSAEGALRMGRGSYIRAARDAGLRFEVKQPAEAGEKGLPPDVPGELPPGFDQ